MEDPIASAARALAELANCAGAGVRAEELVERMARAAPGAPGSSDSPLTPLDALAFTAESLGLKLESIEADLDAAIEWLRWDSALLTAVDDRYVTGEERTRWVVASREGDQIRWSVHAPDEQVSARLVPESELAATLEREVGRRSRWLVLRLGVAPTLEDALQPSAPPPPASHLDPWTRLMRLLRPDRGDLIAVGVFAIAIGVLLLATPIAVQALVNFVALGGAIPPLIVVALLLFLGLAFAAALTAVQTWVVEILQRRMFVRVVADLTARLPRVAFGTHDEHFGPELVNRFLDVATIQKVGSSLLLDGLSLLLSVTVGLVVLAFYHPLLLAFDIVLLAVIALIVFGPLKQGVKTAKHESTAKYEVVAWLEEIARNPILYKTSGAQKWIFERSDRVARTWVEARSKHFRVVFGQALAAFGLHVLSSTALLSVGGLLVIQGSLTLGQLVAAELIVTLVVSSVSKIGKHLESYYDLMSATEKVGKLLDLEVEPLSGEHHAPSAGSRGVSLEATGLGWAPVEGSTLFEDVSFSVAAGERLGVRGPSGAGKSTLLQLIWGLRRPSAGALRIDGRDTRELSLDALRRMASLVDRAELFVGTLRENVRLARPFVSDDDVRAALGSVGLLDEVRELPDGLDTRISGHGRPLSAGQIERLQIARAIAGRPKLLLVSAAFGTLEGEAQRRLLDALFDAQAPWTLVIASNEPSVLERCDRVLSMPDGVTVQSPSAGTGVRA